MKIICVGKNYEDHIKEMSSLKPSSPVIFLKPPTSITLNGSRFSIPDFSNEIHHEIELVIKISRNGKNIKIEDAQNHFREISLGIDFTARDIQNYCKKMGYPWELSKAFDGSAAIGDFIAKDDFDINNINFYLNKNNKMVQRGNSSEMIFSFNQIISFVSNYFTIEEGDLIYTGTPSGVGAVNKFDKLDGYLNNKKLLHVAIS